MPLSFFSLSSVFSVLFFPSIIAQFLRHVRAVLQKPFRTAVIFFRSFLFLNLPFSLSCSFFTLFYLSRPLNLTFYFLPRSWSWDNCRFFLHFSFSSIFCSYYSFPLSYLTRLSHLTKLLDRNKMFNNEEKFWSNELWKINAWTNTFGK